MTSKMQSDQLVNEAALAVLRTAARAGFDTIAAGINTNFDQPVRLFASNPSDSKLNIQANKVIDNDGGARTTPPINSSITALAATTIDFQSGTISPSGNILLQGGTFALPTSVSGQFIRMAIVLRSDGKLDSNFSSNVASYGSLPDPGSLFSSLSGLPVGYVDLVGTASSTPGAFKTASSAGSSATNIIENAVSGQPSIWRFGSGGGAGGSGITDFKLLAIVSNVASIQAGYIQLSDGRILTTSSDGSTPNTQVSLNLKTQTNSAGVTAPAANTTYGLYLDLNALPSITTIDASSGLQGYLCAAGTSGPFVVLATAPAATSPTRYVFLQELKTNGSSNYTGLSPVIGRSAEVDVQRAALPVTRQAAGLARETVMSNFDTEVNVPVRIYADNPSGTKIFFGASQISGSDGTGRSVPPQDSVVNNAFPTTSLDMSNSTTSGGGSILRDGSAFSMTAQTAGTFVRVAFVFTPSGAIDSTIGVATTPTTKSTLPNPGSLFSKLNGIPLGWIDLVTLAGGTTFKTADSAGTSVLIENSVAGTAQIVRFGSGSAPSGTSDFKILSISANVATLKAGYIQLTDGRILTTSSDGSTPNSQVSLNLLTGVNNTGVTSPAASTTYYLYLDLNALPAAVTIDTSSGLQGYLCASGTSGPFVILALPPTQVSSSRYAFLQTLKTNGSSNYTANAPLVVRTIDTMAPLPGKLQSLSAAGAAILKGGVIALDDGRQMALGSGTTEPTINLELAASLATVLTNSGLSFTANTLYTLVIDLATVLSGATTAITTTDSHRTVYLVGQSNLKLLVLDPSLVNPQRYVWLDQIYVPVSATDWTNAVSVPKADKIHNTMATVFNQLSYQSIQVSAATSGNVTASHALLTTPTIVEAYYFNGTTTRPVDANSIVVNVTATQITYTSDAYTVGGGSYLLIFLAVPATQTNIANNSRTFTQAWQTSNAVTTVAHLLTDMEDIKGYEVQEWNVTTGKRRNIDRSGLVANFDATNFYLDWTGLSPSSTLQYRVVAGGSPLPWSIPTRYGGFSRFVGFGPGSYATITAALVGAQAGDSILVAFGYSITATEVVNVADVRIEFMPGVIITMTSGSGAALQVTAARVSIINGYWQISSSSATIGVQWSVGDGFAENLTVETINAAATLINGYKIDSTQTRNRLLGLSTKATLGSISNRMTDSGSDNVWQVV